MVLDRGSRNNIVYCASNLAGMTAEDVGNAIGALGDLSRFSTLPDRIQQGVLAFQFLGRLMTSEQGFSANAAFQVGGSSVLKTDELYYDGNSQGAILGGPIVATSTDVQQAIPLKEDDVFTERKISDSIQRILGKYREKGLFNASIRVRKSEIDPKKNTINITFVVDEGEHIKIAKINLLGVTKADPEDVLAVLPAPTSSVSAVSVATVAPPPTSASAARPRRTPPMEKRPRLPTAKTCTSSSTPSSISE